MGQKIIMNFTTPPSGDDLEALAQSILETLPEELMEYCDGIGLQIEDLPDEVLESDLELEDPYEVLAFYKNGKQIAPGVESKVANDDDMLVLFRRSLLDYWCESGEDLTIIMREVIIEELGKTFDFSDDEIEEMADRHSQIMF